MLVRSSYRNSGLIDEDRTRVSRSTTWRSAIELRPALVGVVGVEPTASWPQTRRLTNKPLPRSVWQESNLLARVPETRGLPLPFRPFGGEHRIRTECLSTRTG